ncbi:TENA/THI-4 family [gamma proteobacterium HTCC5015]|nr:TENA/THI-4 family [gamma proteobacterium HTCC5015]
MPAKKYKEALELTPHPEWAQQFWDDLVPLKNKVAQHRLFREMADGSLSLERFRRALLNFYPLVENFPKYMGQHLAKTRPGIMPGHEEAKIWLIDNIRVEQRHAFWYQDWAEGFGIEIEALERCEPPAAMDAINHFLWNMGAHGSLEEGLAATNLAVEWATGEWSQQVAKGIRRYTEHDTITINRRTEAWLRAHAAYDDEHPYEAMELIKRTATTDDARTRAFKAAQRGLEYYILALDDCYDPLLG